MPKHQRTTFGIFTEAVGLYFSNIGKFIKYMTFPVMGQILGLILILFTTYMYVVNMPKLILKYPNLDNINSLIIISVLLTLPGLAIFCKAFWEYLLAYGAINSMFANMINSGKVYDFEAHTELIKRRSLPFITLWLLIGIYSLLAVCPLLIIICLVFAVYFILVFQVFTFEPDLSPIGCAKRSFMLIKGKFGSTFFLIISVGLFTYFLVPQVSLLIFDSINVSSVISKAVLPFIKLFPELVFSKYGIVIKQADISIFIVHMVIAQIFIQYTLPLRSILWSLWYKELNGSIAKQELTHKTKKSSKRPSEKLMEASKKKFSKKKLDDNIIKRAMEKDEDD